MTSRPHDPARVFVRGFGASEGIEWGFWLAVIVYWVVDLDLGPFELVLMGLVLESAVLVAETPTGVVADLRSRKASIMIGQVMMGVGFIWAVASTNYWVIMPAQVLFGVGWTFRSGADTAWVTDELRGQGRGEDHEVEQLLLKKHRVGIGFAIGVMVIVAAFGTLTSVRWAAVLTGLGMIGVAAYFWRVMDEEHFEPATDRDDGFVDVLRSGIGVVRGSPRLRVLVLVILFLDLGAEAFDRLGHKHFIDTLGLDEDSLVGLAVLFITLAIAGILVNRAASSALHQGRGVARVAFALLVVAAVGGAVASATNIVVVLAIGLLLQDSTREALWPVFEGWANRDAPSEVRATVHSLMGQTTSVGELIGGLLLGAIAEASSIRVSLVVATVLYATAAVLSTGGIARQPVALAD